MIHSSAGHTSVAVSQRRSVQLSRHSVHRQPGQVPMIGSTSSFHAICPGPGHPRCAARSGTFHAWLLAAFRRFCFGRLCLLPTAYRRFVFTICQMDFRCRTGVCLKLIAGRKPPPDENRSGIECPHFSALFRCFFLPGLLCLSRFRQSSFSISLFIIFRGETIRFLISRLGSVVVGRLAAVIGRASSYLVVRR